MKAMNWFTASGTALGAWQNPEYLNTSKRITIGRENILLLDIEYRCYLSKQLNFVSEIMGEDQLIGHSNIETTLNVYGDLLEDDDQKSASVGMLSGMLEISCGESVAKSN